MSIVLPPVVRTATAHPERSERYAHVNTEQIIEVMKREGFEVASVTVGGGQRTLRANENATQALYSRHQVDFRHELMRADRTDGYGRSVGAEGSVARLLFTNAHDGSSSARLEKGVWRKVCANGLIMPRTEEMAVIRHTGDAAAEVIRRAMSLAKSSAKVFKQIDEWSAIETKRGERREFARLAAMLRWGDPHRFDLDTLLKPRREDDDRGDLWTVFNVVQENCVRGGFEGLSENGRATTARPLSELEASGQFNSALWTLAGEFAELRAPITVAA